MQPIASDRRLVLSGDRRPRLSNIDLLTVVTAPRCTPPVHPHGDIDKPVTVFTRVLLVFL